MLLVKIALHKVKYVMIISVVLFRKNVDAVFGFSLSCISSKIHKMSIDEHLESNYDQLRGKTGFSHQDCSIYF